VPNYSSIIHFFQLYLQYRLAGKIPLAILVPIFQVVIGCSGLVISYSRIADHKHHWTDVSVGISVGVTVTIWLVSFLINEQPHSKNCSAVLEPAFLNPNANSI
jgi:membrane-associated phospholipid phosphatase